MNSHPSARCANERGIALILTLFLVLATSIIVSSIMFLGQNETFAGTNYRLMSQARYGAESGVQKAANFLLYNYTAPTAAGVDAIANYTYAGQSPVLFNGNPVVLSANPSVASNYPVAAVVTAFQTQTGALAASNATVTYAPYATLVSMQQVNGYGGGIVTIQTWQITSDGTVTGAAGRTAQVEVSSVLETQATPASTYAAFATNGGCGAIDLKGNNTVTGSYSSTAALAANGQPVTSNTGGNMGTNGNLTEAGGATVFGTLSTPRVGVGACSAGNVDAVTSSGGASICPDPNQACNGVQTGGLVQLPQAVNLPPPAAPNPLPPTTAYNGNGQTLLNGASVGDVTVNANSKLTLGAPGVTSIITMNSLTLNGNATLQVLGTVILKIAGQNQTTPISLTGGSVTNGAGATTSDYNPADFQILYSGTGTVKSAGGSTFVGMIYAPNADVQLTGGTSVYGSVVGNTVEDMGGATIYYDKNLSKEFYTIGNAMLSAFSWKKY